jgi:heme-degrading monooxygenase HmoA
MYARSTTFHGDPHRIDEALTYLRDRAMPALMGMDGFVGISMLADRGSGRCIITSSFEDLAALHRSASEMRGIRARTADILQSPQALEEWQIALLHRERSAPEGARTRVTWCRTDPDRLDPTLDAYAESIVPRLSDLPGFCSVSVLADPVEGRSVAAVTFADDATLEQAGAQLTPLLQELGRQYAGEVTDEATFDLVLAHLRVPETV